MKRIAKVEADLTTIQKDGAAIQKQCAATPDEIQTAIQAYKQKLHDAECLVLGIEFGIKDAKAALRRLSR